MGCIDSGVVMLRIFFVYDSIERGLKGNFWFLMARVASHWPSAGIVCAHMIHAGRGFSWRNFFLKLPFATRLVEKG